MNEDDKDEGVGHSEKEGIRDMIKRIVSVGVGSAFMTDETVKNLLSDIPLPKDIMNGLLQNARQAKVDFIETVRDEVKNQIGKVDASRLVDDLAERYDIEVSAHVSFKKKKEAPSSEKSEKTKATRKTRKSKK